MKELTSQEFEKEILNGVTVIDFFATWCGPCKMLAPTFEKLAEEYEGKAKFFKIDIDKEMEIARELSIMSVPTIMIYKDGKDVDKIVGVATEDILKNKIDNAL